MTTRSRGSARQEPAWRTAHRPTPASSRNRYLALTLAAGVPVGLGVDGVASNEIGALFPEVRQALFTARLRTLDATSFDHLDALSLATQGGADCLGRADLGRLEPGAAADLAFWPVEDLADIADALVGLVFGPDRRVDRLVVRGRTVVEGAALRGVDLAGARRDLARRTKRLHD